MITPSQLVPRTVYAGTSFDTLTQGRLNFELCNDTTTGTSLNFLAKYNGATPACAVKAGVTDADGVIGVVSNGSGTSGYAVITYRGYAQCSFDGNTTAGDFVVASTTNPGDCHDAGAIRPTGAQVLGRVESSNTGTGTYGVRVTLDAPLAVGAPTASPTFTGTVTGPDGGTWTASGLTSNTTGTAGSIGLPQLASNCTLYVSPSGSGNGLTPSTPESLSTANTNAAPGDHICLEGGTYNIAATMFIAQSGTSAAPIVWEAYGDSTVAMVWTGTSTGAYHQMFGLYGTWPNGINYVTFRGRNMWTWDGSGYAYEAISDVNGHHLVVDGMYIKNMIAAALDTVGADYVNWNHNVAWHNGENPNGISLNTANVTSVSCSGTACTLVAAASLNVLNQNQKISFATPSCSAFNGNSYNALTFNNSTFTYTFTGPSGGSCSSGTATSGYSPGWSSAFSINSSRSFDAYAGIHNFVYDNIAVGTYDSSANHTDGNGIILDWDTNGAWPPTLILNNIVYGNGGRCIGTNKADQNNTLIINNTCYKNGLDSANSFDEVSNFAAPLYVINNISYGLGTDGCTPHSATCEYDYTIYNSPSPTTFAEDVYYGGYGNNFSNGGLVHGDPAFLNPPSLASGGYGTAPDPGVAGSSLGTGLNPSQTGAAKGIGVDPTSYFLGLNANILSDLASLVYEDFNGSPRGPGRWDVGAIQASISPPGVPWGQITGNLAAQKDLAAALGNILTNYAPLASPTFTGTVTEPVPTLPSQTANYFLAAPNGSAGAPGFRAIVGADVPTLNQNTTGTAAGLSGTPALPNGTTATTQTAGDNSQKLATTAYVRAENQMVFTCPVGGTTTGSVSYCGWITPAGITITQFDVFASTAPSGCSTWPVIQVWDGTGAAEVGSYSITMSTAQEQNVTGSTNFTAGHSLRVRVVTGASGCGTNASNVVAAITYQMQN